jgi:hypothetical protein
MPKSTHYKKIKTFHQKPSNNENDDEQQSTSENNNNINNDINFDNTSHQMHFKQDNILEDNVNYSDNSDEVQIENDESNEIGEISDCNAIKQEELAAAFLAYFYNGTRTSQSSLSDYLKLSNISSPIKLPTTFDGLSSLLINKTTKLKYVKSWFCCFCLKTIDKLNDRYQRNCPTCHSK